MRRMTTAAVTPSLPQAVTRWASRARKRRNGIFGHSSAPAKKLHSKSRHAYSTSCGPMPASPVAFAVGAYITGAYWFTASTSFANPAVTLARSVSDTFAGIRPQDAPGFILAQLAGACAATLLFRWLAPSQIEATYEG